MHKSTAIINVSFNFFNLYHRIVFFYKIKCVQSISILISPPLLKGSFTKPWCFKMSNNHFKTRICFVTGPFRCRRNSRWRPVKDQPPVHANFLSSPTFAYALLPSLAATSRNPNSAVLHIKHGGPLFWEGECHKEGKQIHADSEVY